MSVSFTGVLPKPGLPLPFGRYLLVEKIASGGMAEVFRAVLRGAAGFEKPLAVKRILPIFNEEPDFIALFQDEARIVSTLAHANIAQVFEFGEVDGSSYIALELVDGLDLGRVMQRLRAAGQPMPLATAAFIVAEAARGLSYAHEKRDDAGRLIGIVHRDVSPPNILISMAGEVKVADFGIAKAANKVHKTETGVVMGKLRYMSPEQVAGEPLDGRSDVFSLGVILHELLGGGPIYPGDQSFRLADLIRSEAAPPPSTRNPAVPPALDEIVGRALAKRREDRYARAGDLARDLTVFLATQAPGFNREDLGALVTSLIPPRSTLPVDPHIATELAAPPLMTAPTQPADPRRQLDLPTRSRSGPAPVQNGRRRGVSTEALVGIILAVVIAGSGVLVFVRFILPGHDTVRPDAAHVLTPPPVVLPDAAAGAPSTAPFALVRSTGVSEAKALVDAVDRFDVTRRGLPRPDYAAYLTGVDTGLGLIVLGEDGKALPLAPLPPGVQALVSRAGVDEAVAATLEAVRQTGELPLLVRASMKNFLNGRPAVVATETVGPGGRVPPYSAAGIAVWLEPQSRARRADLAFANDSLGRWCEPVAPPARRFAPILCERAALVTALRAADPKDPAADALERWEHAALADDAGLGLRDAEWVETSRPDERELRVALAAPVADPASVILLAGGISPTPGQAADDLLVWKVPARVVAPVLKLPGGGLLRLPPVPFGR